MTKSIKNLLLVILSTLLVFSSVILLFPTNTAKAEDGATPSDKLSDNNFAFMLGAGLNPGTENGVFELGYRLTLNNYKDNIDSITSLLGQQTYVNQFGMRTRNKSFFANTFTVSRYNIDTTSTELYSVTIAYSYDYSQRGHIFQNAKCNGLAMVVGTKKLSYCDETLNYKHSDNEWTNEKYIIGALQYTNNSLCSALEYVVNNGYSVTEYNLVTDDAWIFNDFSNSTENPVITISAVCGSPFVEYFLTYNYRMDVLDFHGSYENTQKYKTSMSGTINSDSRSAYYILNKMNENNQLENYYTQEQIVYINEILTAGAMQTVNIEYLIPIKGTPFATKTRVQAEVPVISGTIKLDDVYAYLGIETMDCYDAHVKSFEFVTDNLYVARYYKSSWLKAITVDGNAVDYFHDINKSYADYYGTYVELGVFSESVYEYMFSKILSTYPQLEDYQTTPENVYGLWGMAVLPETYSINAMWKNLFGAETTRGEFVATFTTRKLLTLSEYNGLLSTYEYAWLQQAWNMYAGFVNGTYADYYMFYMEPGTSVSFLDLAGNTEDPDDVLKGDNNNGVVGGFIQDVGKDLKNVFDNVWGTVTGILKTPTGLVSVVVIVLAGVVAFSFIKTGGKSGGKRRR